MTLQSALRELPPDPPASGDTYETTRTFESLGIGVELVKALADQGITTAFPIQALTVADALEGRDVCGRAKTGSGKTLAFGLPLLQRCAEAAVDHRAGTRPNRETVIATNNSPLSVAAHSAIAANNSR